MGRPPAPDLQQTGHSTHRAGPGRRPGPGPQAAEDKGLFARLHYVQCRMYNVRAKVDGDPDHLRPTAHHHAVPTVRSVQPTPVGNGGLLARTSGGRCAMDGDHKHPETHRSSPRLQTSRLLTLKRSGPCCSLRECMVVLGNQALVNGPFCKSLVDCCRQSHLFITYLGTHSLTHTLPLPPFSSSPAPVVSLHLHSPVQPLQAGSPPDYLAVALPLLFISSPPMFFLSSGT